MNRRPPFWGKHLRREVQVVLDVLVLLLAFVLSYLLRFDFELPGPHAARLLAQLPVVLALQFSVLLATGIYRFVWRYVGMAEIRTFLRAALFSTLPLLLLRLGLPERLEIFAIPRSIILLDAVLAFSGLLGLRVLRRSLYERYERDRREIERRAEPRQPVMLVGAGRAGVMAVREIQGRGNMDLELVGFVDDAEEKQGSVISGLRVLGRTRDLERLIRKHRIAQVVITMADAPAGVIRGIVETCDASGTPVRIIPGYYEILQGSVSISRFREVRIEDLLGRDPVELDEEKVRSFLTGKCVLLTGAGGSIGSELARQIARFNPLRLILIERSEGALFDIERELQMICPGLDLQASIADAGEASRMAAIIGRTRPHVVFHAAAYKHVPMMEQNPAEAVKNNVLATRTLGRLVGDAGAEAFVLISTDKAVRPSSLMGASKRMAELVIQDLDSRYPQTRFLAVRFGNVLGSTGSVVPIFREQIARGGPVTVTHPDATRYFMTVGEAAQLVLEAGAIGAGGEIMILDMGEAVRILDLAKDMIALSGFRPFEDIPITFIGMRPGEKLVEQLELSDEQIDRSRHPKIFIGRLGEVPSADLERTLVLLAAAIEEGRDSELRHLMAEVIPEAELERRKELTSRSFDGDGRRLVH